MKHFLFNIKNYIQNERIFRTSYIICLLLSSLCFLEYPCLGLTAVNMIWALYFLKQRFSCPRMLKRLPYGNLLLLFLISGICTTFLNQEYHFIDNIIMMYHACVCFFLLYGMKKHDSLQMQMEENMQLFQILTTLINIIGILGILFFIIFIRVDALSYTIGLFDNRYTGFYTHPNIAAFISMIGIIGCHMLWKKKKPKTNRYYLPSWFCIMGICTHFVTIWIADSNASFVYICVYFFVYTFIRQELCKKINLSKLMKIVCISGMFILCSYILRNATQTGMVTFIQTIHTPSDISYCEPTDVDSTATTTTTIEIGRTEQKDLSSGRLDSFFKAFLLFEIKPVMGIGKANIVPYGETYLVEGFRFFDLHNGYLTILLSCGLVGFIPFMIFLFQLLKKAHNLLKNFDTITSAEQHTFTILISALLGYGVYALFERTLLFDITFMVIIFWVLLGQFISTTVSYEKEGALYKNWGKSLSRSLRDVQRFFFR